VLEAAAGPAAVAAKTAHRLAAETARKIRERVFKRIPPNE
jgi:hypothetical protein